MTQRMSFAQRVDEAGRALGQALGSNVACIAAWGASAEPDWSPMRGDAELIIVLRRVRFADLRLVGATLTRLARHDLPFATPLVVSPSFLRDARDSFAVELWDLQARHRLIAGEDLLESLEVAPQALRVAAEREARTALLRLRSLAVHRPSDGELQLALAGLASSFPAIAAGLLVGRGSAARPEGRAMIDALAARAGAPLGSLATLLEVRAGVRRWPADEDLDRLLAGLHDELERLAMTIDAYEA